MFHGALSSFSDLTFRAADIMLEKIFCKSMRTASKVCFILTLCSASDPIFLPFTSPPCLFGALSSPFISPCHISLRLFVHLKRSAHHKPRPVSDKS